MAQVEPSLFRTLLAALSGAWLVVLVPVAAAQHATVERGRALLEEADFPGALAAFDEAARASDLGHADLVRLVEGRALAHLALAHDQALAREMAILASIDPEHEWGVEAPPEAREHFARAAQASPGPLRIDVQSTPQPGGIAIAASVENDPGALAGRVRISARAAGGAWQTSDDGGLTLQAAPGARVDYYAIAIGPGGAPIAHSGTQAAPLRVTVPGTADLSGGGGGGGGGGEGGGSGATTWILLGAGAAAVLVVVGIILIAGASGDSLTDRTRPNAPVVAGF